MTAVGFETGSSYASPKRKRGTIVSHWATNIMARIHRRDLLRVSAAVIPGAAILSLGHAAEPNNASDKVNAMKIHYFEIVTPDVNAACDLYSQMHGVTFSKADQNLGGARTAKLAGGGMLGIRAPLRSTEKPVVRPYLLVEDIKASVAAAAKAGAKIAMEPTEILGYGQFAIVVHGGIESGLWQV
jgi:predicted enzyme related to lactoylglutathione lyase